jgi:hypothetical protein
MDKEKELPQPSESKEPADEFQVSEIDDQDLDTVAGGFSTPTSGSGCDCGC